MVEREAFQEIDYRRMYSECAKWVGSIDRVDRIDEFISHAFHVAQSGRKGPVVLALPEDVLYLTDEEKPTAAAHIVQPGLDRDVFAQAMRQFTTAKNPIVLAGGGNWNSVACDHLRTWANREGITVATSFRSQDLIDNQDPCYAGDLGIGANPALVKRIQDADVLLVIGERLGEMTTAGYSILKPPASKHVLIHVLSGPEELGRVYRPDFAINCSPENFCKALVDIKMDSRYQSSQKEAHAQYLAFSAPISVQGDLQLAEIMASLPNSIPRNAILTNGAGNFATWLHRFYQATRYSLKFLGEQVTIEGHTVQGASQNGCSWRAQRQRQLAHQKISHPKAPLLISSSCQHRTAILSLNQRHPWLFWRQLEPCRLQQ
jgi:acetolactate synthase-1/2/3 large subunit